MRGLSDYVILVVLIGLINCENFDSYQLNESENEISDQRLQAPRGFMDKAKEMIGSPAGQMAVHFAKELVSRSTGGNQILSLNITNLLILVFLKALILAAGLIGAGSWNYYGRGRSLDDDNLQLIASDEPSLMLGFLAAEGSNQDSCLGKAACHSPKLANEYVKAAKAILKGAEMFESGHLFNPRYQELLKITEIGVKDGYEGAPCDLIYHCST